MITAEQLAPYERWDEPQQPGPSEFDDDIGWAAGAGDRGASNGRQPTGGELAAKLRQDARGAMEQAYPPPDDAT